MLGHNPKNSQKNLVQTGLLFFFFFLSLTGLSAFSLSETLQAVEEENKSNPSTDQFGPLFAKPQLQAVPQLLNKVEEKMCSSYIEDCQQ